MTLARCSSTGPVRSARLQLAPAWAIVSALIAAAACDPEPAGRSRPSDGGSGRGLREDASGEGDAALAEADAGDEPPRSTRPGDAGARALVVTGARAGGPCTRDHDCSDDDFCNGVERCVWPEDRAVGSCVAAQLPRCLSSQQCDPVRKLCISDCDRAPDADGDTYDAFGCGGYDCDDADADRRPGNLERCDLGHDEDCADETLGWNADLDGDGHDSRRCCNGEECGADCNDADTDLGRLSYPGAAELCDGEDNDCDAASDETVRPWLWYPDADGDLHGARDARPQESCGYVPQHVLNASDCDDMDAGIRPGAIEVCDGTDNDCARGADDGLYCGPCQCTLPYARVFCGTDPYDCQVSDCHDDREDCDDLDRNGCEADLSASATCGQCGIACDVDADCVRGGGSHACVCRDGYTGPGTFCEDIDECAEAHGGCDALATCINQPGSRLCDCPDVYYTGTGEGPYGCLTTLTRLALSAGALAPPLEPDLTHYELPLTFATASLELAPEAKADVRIEVNGEALARGETWTGPLEFGPNPVALTLHELGRPARAYGLRAHRGHQQAYIKASNAEAEDFFGTSVAISGDTLVVGAPYEDSSGRGVDADQQNDHAQRSGAAYVFVREGERWTQQAYLKAGDAEEEDRFGASVAISGDTIVVGAPYEGSDALPESGAVYVFLRREGHWTEQASLKASNAEPGDTFGESVAISGDTIVVGAPWKASAAVEPTADTRDESALGAGAAYVFVRRDSTWSERAYLKPSASGDGYAFGASVAIAGSVIAVGAPHEPGEGPDVFGSGAAYVFDQSGETWAETARLRPRYPTNGQDFGRSVSVAADLVAVGAPGERSMASGVNGDEADIPQSAHGVGAVFVFTRDGQGWSQQAYLKASNPDNDDHFGISVAAGESAIAVGARWEAGAGSGVGADPTDDSAQTSGAMYIFLRDGGSFAEPAYVKPSNADIAPPYGYSDMFGSSVAVSGDTIVAASPMEDSQATGINGDQANDGAIESGAVYVFR